MATRSARAQVPHRWTEREARRSQREFWDARFDGDADHMGSAPSPMAERALRALPTDGRGPRLVELGCGTGRDLVRFAGRGYTVASIDVSPVAVRAARVHSLLAARPGGTPPTDRRPG
jgi:SAM-dependent methyltransferase